MGKPCICDFKQIFQFDQMMVTNFFLGHPVHQLLSPKEQLRPKSNWKGKKSIDIICNKTVWCSGRFTILMMLIISETYSSINHCLTFKRLCHLFLNMVYTTKQLSFEVSVYFPFPAQ